MILSEFLRILQFEERFDEGQSTRFDDRMLEFLKDAIHFKLRLAGQMFSKKIWNILILPYLCTGQHAHSKTRVVSSDVVVL